MLVAVKLGGSVITDKSKFKTPNYKGIHALADMIAALWKEGIKFIVVHGAGSYAHIPSKKYGLADGIMDEHGRVHFAEVHSLCEQLSILVVDALIENGVPAVSFHPATFVVQKNKLPVIIDDALIRKYLNEGFVPVTHGDVVLDEALNTSIISGDKLMEHFGRVIADKLVFASDVDGLLTSLDGNGRLIEKVTRANFDDIIELVGGSQNTDVTGGMAGKIKNIMNLKIKTIVVNGNHPQRVKNAIKGKNDVYTEFIP